MREKVIPCLRRAFQQNKMELGSGSLLKAKQWPMARRKGYHYKTSTNRQISALDVVIFCVVQRCDSGLRSSSG